MSYFVTGGTGFIGRFLLAKLLERDADIYVLVRPGSEYKLTEVDPRLAAAGERLKIISGDLSQPLLGISKADIERLTGRVKHFFHLAAYYDLDADLASQTLINVGGTKTALDVAEVMQAGCFHYVSSIAVAGFYNGIFRENMFAEAGPLTNPYFQTKHEAEALVRSRTELAYRIYRPSIVVGHSLTGYIDRVTGPYYLLPMIKQLQQHVPEWLPLLGVDSGCLNVVPVDYVVDALDFLAHQEHLDRGCFHLISKQHYSMAELINLFAKAAGAPQLHFKLKLPKRLKPAMSKWFKPSGRLAKWLQQGEKQLAENLDIPAAVLAFWRYQACFDDRNTQAQLLGSGIECPDIESYVEVLWRYWRQYLDAERAVGQPQHHAIVNRVIVITGASSGIGRATALRLAGSGAQLILAARRPDRLETVRHLIVAVGGKAESYPVDVADAADADRFIGAVLKKYGHVDVLINCAGRSIRRSVKHSFERFHDYERTMQLNYFGALRLIMGFLPAMEARGGGHIINISSIGTLTKPARFSAYVASKTALDAFASCAAAELSDRSVFFTTINMPLVRTPMIEPTKIYRHMPAISPEQAAEMIYQAIVKRPKRVATKIGIAGEVVQALTPKLAERVINKAFRMFPDSAAAKGEAPKVSAAEMTSEQKAFGYLLKGGYW